MNALVRTGRKTQTKFGSQAGRASNLKTGSRPIVHSYTRRRSTSGQSLAELCAGLIVGIPIILAGMDLGFIAIGATINDAVCREAARAAASGPPADTQVGYDRKVSGNQAPYRRVIEVIRQQYKGFAIPVSPELTETVTYYPLPEAGGAVEGNIAVKTTAYVIPPFILKFFNGSRGFHMTSLHQVPYTYVLMPTPEKNP